MVNKLNQLVFRQDIQAIDYWKDIYAYSKASKGGIITERHILYALAKKITKQIGKGEILISFLENKLKITIPGKIRNFLLEEKNPYYLYDLLGVLKSSYLPKMYIQPDKYECISVFKAVQFAHTIGAIPAYAYLGDISESPTGDKKSQKFEDDFLEDLFSEIKRIGFKAVTYMPPRNTIQQLERVQRLCHQYDLMEISGVDINHPRQSFNCPIIMKSQFSHLVDMTWALIAHEKLAHFNPVYALFHERNPFFSKTLKNRLKIYSLIGRAIDPACPERVAHLIQF
jgi:hypothetical protein